MDELYEYFKGNWLIDCYPDEFDRKLNVCDYVNAKAQIKVMQTLTFGSEINVLLITDRMPGCANGLREYLQNSTDITVDLVNRMEDAKKIASNKRIDFLIIVGYLEKKRNYKAMQAVKNTNKHVSVIIYAGLDCVIDYECDAHGIILKYDRYKSIEGFIAYMRGCYDSETARI